MRLKKLLIEGADKEHRINGDKLDASIKWSINNSDCTVKIMIHRADVEFFSSRNADDRGIVYEDGSRFYIRINDGSRYAVSYNTDGIIIGGRYDTWSDGSSSIEFMKVYIDKMIRAFRKVNGFSETGLESVCIYEHVTDNLFRHRKTKRLYMLCDSCKEYILKTEFGEDTHNCSKCFPNLVKCNTCNNYFHRDLKKIEFKGNEYCPKCVLRKSEKGVAQKTRYSTKVPPNFLGHGIFHFGIEFEVEVSKDKNYTIQDVMDIVYKFNKHVYFKGDSSISHGIEIITHPCSYEYHAENTSPMLDMLNNINTYGDNTGTCGLHVHVGRDRIVGDREVSIGRIMYLFGKHWDTIVKFARRKRASLDRWSKRPFDGDIKESIIPKNNIFFHKQRKKILDEFFRSCYNNNTGLDKYRAVNLKYEPTIEFRVFDGTTTNRYFLASLQFIHMVMDLANSDIEIVGVDFKDLFYGSHKIFDDVYDELV